MEKSEYTKANNIYDLAGNVFEWTLEAYSNVYRIFRGGYFYDHGSVSATTATYIVTYYYGYPNNSLNYCGCRSALYIK